jgi:hypothetical protein
MSFTQNHNAILGGTSAIQTSLIALGLHENCHGLRAANVYCLMFNF